MTRINLEDSDSCRLCIWCMYRKAKRQALELQWTDTASKLRFGTLLDAITPQTLASNLVVGWSSHSRCLRVHEPGCAKREGSPAALVRPIILETHLDRLGFLGASIFDPVLQGQSRRVLIPARTVR